MKTSLGGYFHMWYTKPVVICNKIMAEVGFCVPQTEISTKRGFEMLREYNYNERYNKLIVTQHVRSV